MREATLTMESPTINNYLLYQLMGYQIIENSHMVDRKQNKIHKKKRVNKKWIKRYGFTATPKKDVFIVGNNIIGHPETIKAFRENEAAKFKN